MTPNTAVHSSSPDVHYDERRWGLENLQPEQQHAIWLIWTSRASKKNTKATVGLPKISPSYGTRTPQHTGQQQLDTADLLFEATLRHTAMVEHLHNRSYQMEGPDLKLLKPQIKMKGHQRVVHKQASQQLSQQNIMNHATLICGNRCQALGNNKVHFNYHSGTQRRQAWLQKGAKAYNSQS
jgi:hypothetical protein